MLAWCLNEDDLFLRLTWCLGDNDRINKVVYSNMQPTLSHQLKTSPGFLKRDHCEMKTLEAQAGSRPVVDTRSKVGKFWKVVKINQMFSISGKYILTQQITRSTETFSNPACLVKRRTVRMRRRRSISEVVLPRKSIHMFGLLSCFYFLS